MQTRLEILDLWLTDRVSNRSFDQKVCLNGPIVRRFVFQSGGENRTMRKRLKGWMAEGGWRGEGDEPHAWFTRKIRGRDSKSVITVRTSSYAGSHPIRQKGWEPPLSPSNGTRGEKKKNGGERFAVALFFSSCHEIESSLSFSLSLSLFVVFHVSICFSISCLSFLTLASKDFSISVNDKNLGLRINVLVFLRGLILSRWGSIPVYSWIEEL